MMNARFITFEGPEGAGKSTQLKLLAARLRDAGEEVVETQEPGGTPLGREIRKLLLNADHEAPRPTTELLLMFASRAQNVDEVILPALGAGKIVLCDRFTDSSVAYQGAARGLGTDAVYDLDRIACRGLVPHLTFLLDVPVEVGLARAKPNRMESEPVAFHRKVREAFLQLAHDDSKRVKLIDSERPKEVVSEEIWNILAVR
jgi:dTMP kinase